jgi:hypothetical protein
VILFDKRGVGLSDRLSVNPTIEARLDDSSTRTPSGATMRSIT